MSEQYCYLCGKKLNSKSKTREHVIPKSLWNDALSVDFKFFEQSNVLPACKSCNERKGSQLLMLPVSTPSWWPFCYHTELENLRVVFKSLLTRIINREDLKIIYSDYYEQWLTDYSQYISTGSVYSLFDKTKVFVDINEYMLNQQLRNDW